MVYNSALAAGWCVFLSREKQSNNPKKKVNRENLLACSLSPFHFTHALFSSPGAVHNVALPPQGVRPLPHVRRGRERRLDPRGLQGELSPPPPHFFILQKKPSFFLSFFVFDPGNSKPFSLPSPPRSQQAVDFPLKVVQTTAVVEIFHSIFGIVKSPFFTTCEFFERLFASSFSSSSSLSFHFEG